MSCGRVLLLWCPAFAECLCLARPEGFEPPTPWFVARYSIQMSYGRFLLHCEGAALYRCMPRLQLLFLAERVGFEPTVGSHLRLISSQVHSTTLPPLRSKAGIIVNPPET